MEPSPQVRESRESHRQRQPNRKRPGLQCGLCERWHEFALGLRGRKGLRVLSTNRATRCIARRSLPCRMQRLQKCDERACLRRAQVLSVRRHISATLDHLANQLVLSQPYGNTVESRTSLPTLVAKRMTVATLLDLENERALPLKSRCAMQELCRHGITAPGVHVWTPGCESRKMRKCPQRDGDQQDCQDSDRPPAPTLFPFPRQKRKKKQAKDRDDRADEKCRRLHRRR